MAQPPDKGGDRKLSTQNMYSNSNKDSHRSASSVGSYTFAEPEITVQGKKLESRDIKSIPNRNTESLRKSYDSYVPPDYASFPPKADRLSAAPNDKRSSVSKSSRPSSSKLTGEPSPSTILLSERKKGRPEVRSLSSRGSESRHSSRVNSIAKDDGERMNRPSFRLLTEEKASKRPSLIDRSSDDELKEKRDRQILLLNIDRRQRQYGWIHVPDDIETYNVEELMEYYDSVELEINSHESSGIYSLGLFAATGVVWLIFSKIFKYRFSFNLACILVGSFHKFRPYIIQLSTKGNGKTFYTDWHPGIKLAMQFGMTIVVSVVVMWAVSSFSQKEESPQITQQRVNEIESLLINYDKHPRDKSGDLDVQALFFSGIKSIFASKGSGEEEPTPIKEEPEDEDDEELKGLVD